MHTATLNLRLSDRAIAILTSLMRLLIETEIAVEVCTLQPSQAEENFAMIRNTLRMVFDAEFSPLMPREDYSYMAMQFGLSATGAASEDGEKLREILTEPMLRLYVGHAIRNAIAGESDIHLREVTLC